jgi:hypothetical protein
LRNEARNEYAEGKRRREREISFSELSEQELARLVTCDEYLTDSIYFDVLGYPVAVYNEAIAAAGGDPDALNAILRYYTGYITVLSTKRLYDEYGNPRLYIDETLRRKLETRLITKILTFDVNRAA